MAPSTPRSPRARDNPGARGGLPSHYKRNVIASTSTSTNTSSGRACRKSDSRPSQHPATRETMREPIVIDSDSDSDSDDDNAAGSSVESAPASLPLLVPSASSPSKAIPVEGRPGRTSTAGSCTTPQHRFPGFWDLLNTPTKKAMNPTPRQNPLPVKDEEMSSRRVPEIWPTPAPLNGIGSRDSTQTPKPMFNGKADGVRGGKTGINVGVSRQEPAAAASTTAITATRDGVPPMFPPAVKARVYSTPKPAVRRNISSGSKKLEAFGFVSAASLVAGTANTTTRNVGTVTPAPIPRSGSISQPIAEPIKQEVSRSTNNVQVQNRSFWSSPRTTHDTSTVATTMPIVEQRAGPESAHLEAARIRISNIRSLPRTPGNTIAAKRAVTPSSSVGTYGDPYAISSDSDSDDDIPSVKSLNSFAENTNAHETASDVEAVLHQLPAFFDSPSPSEHRSSYLAISGATRPTGNARPIITAQSSKRVRDNGIGNSDESEEGKKKRRVRFGGYDEFDSPPITIKQVASAATRLTSPPPTGSPSPASRISASSRLAFTIERAGGPVRRTTALGVDYNSNGRTGSNLYYNPGQDQNQGQDRSGIRENKTSLREKSEKKKRRRKSRRRKTRKKKKGGTKRKAHASGNKAAFRHRNRDREAWRKAKCKRLEETARHGQTDRQTGSRAYRSHRYPSTP